MKQRKLVAVADAYARVMPTIDKVSYLLWYTATEMVGELGFGDCVIYVLDRSTGTLVQQAAYGDKVSLGGAIEGRLEIPIGHGITGHAAMTGQAVLVEDAGRDPRYIVDLYPMRSEVAVPIMVGGSVFGVIDCEAPEPSYFDEDDVELLRLVASLIAPKIELIMEQVTRSQGKQELIEQNLQLSVALENARNVARSGGVGQSDTTLMRLSAGIAHDFNNQLAIMRAALYTDPVTPPNLDMAGQAIDRAAELTNRLLAFSSQQALAPNDVNVGEIADEIRLLLQDTIDQGIVLSTSIGEGVWDVHVDEVSLAQALVTLVFNASDAMPGGGSVQIACSNVEIDEGAAGPGAELEQGEYVVVSVTDDGEGMSPEVKAQAFTPYFTTKNDEERVGLGLSTVYGFARQSGGDALISSVEGEGTTVALYLPRASSDERLGGFPSDSKSGMNHSREDPTPSEPRRGNGEAILVIEDNEQLSGAVVNVLDLLGYRPILADSAEEALHRASEAHEIDLLLVDAMLDNGQVGPDVYDQIVDIVGVVPVIFMSGYANLAQTQLGGRIGDRPFMAKPFTMEELSGKIYDVLGNS